MKKTACILVVDDQETNRLLLADFIDALGQESIAADTGAAALEQMRTHSVDLILLDIMMPVMDGYEVLDAMKADSTLRHLPVIVITGVDDIQSITHCIERGADDYLTKPFSPTLLQARINACLDRKRLHDMEIEYKSELERRVEEAVRQISSTQLATIFAMSKLAESRDPETGEHLERMREYAKILSLHLSKHPKFASRIDEQFIANIYAAAPLHDIGKVGIPDRILQKPGRLTPEEYELMKLHPEVGAETLRAVDAQHPGNTFVRMGVDIALGHHERWDGTGYPHGVSGEAIPLAARILSLADVYDALTSKRCYKEAFSHEKSKAIILEGAGTQFDPDVVEAFIAENEAFVAIRKHFEDSSKILIGAEPVDEA